MISITIGGSCHRCKKFSPGLYKCKSCGNRFCPLCVDNETGICLFCKQKIDFRKV